MQEHKALQVEVVLAALKLNKAELAKQLGLERTAVNKVLTFERSNRPVRKQVANAIGERVAALILDDASSESQ